MDEEVVRRLIDLNQNFYSRFADAFAKSRQHPDPGFYYLLEELPHPCLYLLDIGCGDGRLGRFLLARRAIGWYTGVDFSGPLLARAQAITMGDFHERDLTQEDCLERLGQFHAITCLATLHHIPGRANRLRLLQEMKKRLLLDGRIILSTWQFLENERQQRKLADWPEAGLSAADVEPGDYLLTWQRNGSGLRYVCYIDKEETAALAQAVGLQQINQFYSDGKEGNLSLYTVFAPDEQHST